MDQQKFITELEQVFEMSPGELNAESSLEGEWESVAFLGFLALVDEQYGATLSPQRVLACKTVADLMAYVESQR